MSLRRPSKEQPQNFEFSSSSLEAAKTIIAKYPERKTTKCCNGFTLYSSKTK